MNTPSNRSNRIAAIATAGITTTLVLSLLGALPGCNKAQDGRAAAPSTTIGTVVDESVLSTKVKSALMASDDIKSLDIKVQINKGVVMLSGFAENASQIERAIAVASGVEGVTSVDNQFSLKDGKQTIGNKIDDTVITTKVKAALLADDSMKSLDVAVITRNGAVQLSGFVNNPDQLKRAVVIAKSVEGVTTVVDHMEMKK